ncbi:adhesion G-protein coupled receptor G4 isoform X2 [Esox lucius]|uniref:adhesion G-protein coupled receptor G4 isoform X2 n=1 Tax=Esox lucius TaxID=8010 RepID=UPI001476ECD7|nr:adhesion G-protein coupled receptor G4 isoform X2 [Esox lucius]
MWDNMGKHTSCEDGSVIRWDSAQWGVSSAKARQTDSSLPCALPSPEQQLSTSRSYPLTANSSQETVLSITRFPNFNPNMTTELSPNFNPNMTTELSPNINPNMTTELSPNINSNVTNSNPNMTTKLIPNHNPNTTTGLNANHNPNTTTHPILNLDLNPNTTTHPILNLDLNHITTTQPILSLDLNPNTTTHPILNPDTPTHPILNPDTITHPIRSLDLNPNTTTHPILNPNKTTHPILNLNPDTTTHPIISLNLNPNTTTHPILNPDTNTHPLLNLDPNPDTTTHPIISLDLNPNTTTHPILNPDTTTRPIHNFDLNPNKTTYPILNLNPDTTTHPIISLDLNHNTNTHPILNPDTNTHPLLNLDPNSNTTTHPILSLDPNSNTTSHPILNLNPDTTTHPIISLDLNPNTTTHPILNPDTTTHPILNLDLNPNTTTHPILNPDTTTHPLLNLDPNSNTTTYPILSLDPNSNTTTHPILSLDPNSNTTTYPILSLDLKPKTTANISPKINSNTTTELSRSLNPNPYITTGLGLTFDTNTKKTTDLSTNFNPHPTTGLRHNFNPDPTTDVSPDFNPHPTTGFRRYFYLKTTTKVIPADHPSAISETTLQYFTPTPGLHEVTQEQQGNLEEWQDEIKEKQEMLEGQQEVKGKQEVKEEQKVEEHKDFKRQEVKEEQLMKEQQQEVKLQQDLKEEPEEVKEVLLGKLKKEQEDNEKQNVKEEQKVKELQEMLEEQHKGKEELEEMKEKEHRKREEEQEDSEQQEVQQQMDDLFSQEAQQQYELEELFNQTQQASQLNSSQVEDVMERLEDLLQSPSISQSLAQKALTVISNLMDENTLAISTAASRLIQAIDGLGRKLVVKNNSEILSSNSLVVAVRRVNGTHFQGASFSVSNPDNLQVSVNGRSRRSVDVGLGSVTLPSSLTDGLTLQQQLLASRVQFTFYRTTSLFQDPSLVAKELISPVLGSSVANLTISNLTDNLQFTLRNIRPISANNVTCVFWDFSLNGGVGGWNNAGCYVANTTQEETTCKCNHLTSFAVLLDLSREGVRDQKQGVILTFITYIGCGISAIFLFITLLTYLSFQNLRRDIPSKILVQLCLSLLLLNLMFLLDGWLALFPARGLCICTALFLHYFLLTSFTWSGLEALHMYLSIVRVFNSYLSRYMLKLSLIGWGAPLLVVIVVISVDKGNYGLVPYGIYLDGSSDDFCWLRNDVAFYLAVVAYFSLVFFLNLLVFLVVMFQLERIKKHNPHHSPPRGRLAELRSITGLSILLGLTWSFALFAWGPLNMTFMYLFSIFNSLQGFLIFLFHCAVKESVQRQWRTYLCCGRLRLAEISDWSHMATHNHKKLSVITTTNSTRGPASRSSSLRSWLSNDSGSVFGDSVISDGSNGDVILNKVHYHSMTSQ